jgi:hypothetical protein
MLSRAVSALVLAAFALSAAAEHPAQRTNKAEKPAPGRKANPCAQYGPGFVQLAGTNTCIKTGGAVDVEGGSRR